jgi:hypothetical protein
VTARNIHGNGATSSIVAIKAASVPEAPAAATTTIENIYLKIDWTDPSSNSATIDGYEVWIENVNSSFVNESTYCNGFSNSVILQDSYCLVPMSYLRSTYGLTLGTLIRVKVRAHNTYGYGPYSPVNTAGELIQTGPA